MDEVLYIDGIGKHPAEPSYHRCGCGIAGAHTSISYPLPGCWLSKYRAESHTIMSDTVVVCFSCVEYSPQTATAATTTASLHSCFSSQYQVQA
eukprot:3757293-Amphidinium_carterae.1